MISQASSPLTAAWRVDDAWEKTQQSLGAVPRRVAARAAAAHALDHQHTHQQRHDAQRQPRQRTRRHPPPPPPPPRAPVAPPLDSSEETLLEPSKFRMRARGVGAAAVVLVAAVVVGVGVWAMVREDVLLARGLAPWHIPPCQPPPPRAAVGPAFHDGDGPDGPAFHDGVDDLFWFIHVRRTPRGARVARGTRARVSLSFPICVTATHRLRLSLSLSLSLCVCTLRSQTCTSAAFAHAARPRWRASWQRRCLRSTRPTSS
jgi:hypothetical protein